MKRILASIILAALCFGAAAQNASSFKWGSEDLRYMQDGTIYTAGAGSFSAPVVKAPVLKGWKGERLNAQAVFKAGPESIISVSSSELRSGKNQIPANCVECFAVDYVKADFYEMIGQDISMQPDRLVDASKYKVQAGKTCPVWVSVNIPRYAAAGTYKGTITLKAGSQEFKLPISVTVVDRELPKPEEWAFHLDLWQNPYAVARWFDVPLWSSKHFERMRPIYRRYAEAGGKVITASIIQHPWNCQTYDPFEDMIVKMKGIDGKWSYDYTVFDKWIEFMFSCGITEQIDCYTMVPWGYTFAYIDLATASVKNIECEPGAPEYEAFWLPFLKDFAKHLKDKGWFDITCIAMDERPTDQMVAARNIIKKADPDFRLEGAVNYSPEVVDIMHDISIGYDHSKGFPEEAVLQRKAQKHYTTLYTCCGPEHPNTFTFSPLAEAEFLGLAISARNYDGYLRWALNSWPEDPIHDSRFGGWVSGDTWLLYPEGSSIRFERLRAGIQDFEKVRILRAEGNPAVNAALDKALEPFIPVITDESINAAKAVKDAKAVINKF